MGLLSVLKRKSSPSGATPPEGGDEIQRARTRARQRLIGAVVLIGIGIVGFPLLFETHPRPIPVDLPIAIANKDKAPPLAMPPRAGEPRAEATAPPIITERREDAGREVPPPARADAPAGRERAAPGSAPGSAPASASAAAPERAQPRPHAPAAVPAPTPTPTPTPKPAPPSVAPKPAMPSPSPARPSSGDDGARAQAMLEGRDADKSRPAAKPQEPATPASGSRFIVQAGAFSEADAARDMRRKVEQLGLKTYTQVVDTASGSRIRVRVGPFATRDEADRAAGKLKSAGLSAAVLAL